ncbi:hypothetical protein GRB29_01365 [Streptococcus pneumoniae]|nr:hypothetical protein [Streptococcus pneumoniae]
MAKIYQELAGKVSLTDQVTTPVIVTNSDDYQTITIKELGTATLGKEMIELEV